MSDKQFRVTFQPYGRTVSVLEGTTIIEAAARAGLVIDTPCGGGGTCGKCRVRITSGVDPHTDADAVVFSDDELRDGWRLACQNQIRRDSVAHIPERSLFGGGHQIVQAATTEEVHEVVQSVRKMYVELTCPTREDDAPDLLRLEQKVGYFKTDLAMLRQLSGKIRRQDFKGTAVLTDHCLIDFEPGDTTGKCFGVAFDIGTTTLVASLLDLRTGQELGVESCMNPQVAFGDDVLSRIKHSRTNSNCLEELRRSIVHEIAAMIHALCSKRGVEHGHVYEATFAGNTTMEQLLCGVDPSQLGEFPFVPTHARGLMLPARELEIPIHPRGAAYIFPVIGGFVGGDTVAGMLATRIDAVEGPTLMVDIGTNGEIVVAAHGCLYAASTAAGPAFEGARITCGMRASRGAIEKVTFDGDAHLGVIGDAAPIGICGSGLIDLAAALLSSGIISFDGRLLRADELPAGIAEPLKARLRINVEGQVEFLLADSTTGKGESPVLLTQRDVRELQLGSGAIRAGIAILLKVAGINVADLKTVLIAGGFGSFIRRSSAQRIGLLPPGIDHKRIHYVGNVSLAGAKWALLSATARKAGEELSRRTRHVDLSISEDFQTEFADAMIFPEHFNTLGSER